MIDGFDFVIGQQYENRNGTFTVLEVSPPTIRVRYDNGVEETLDMAIQARIQRNKALPPRTPEPPPRRRTTTPARAAAVRAPAPRVGAPAEPAPRAPRAPAAPRARRSSPGAAPTSTLGQILEMVERDQQGPRLELLRAAVSSPPAFRALIERSDAALAGPFQAFTVEHVQRLNQAGPAPTRQEPALLLGSSIAQNRSYLATPQQEVLTWHFPLYELGMERFVVGLLGYDTAARRAILVNTRIKTTQRHWLWETLLDSLRMWIAVSHTPNFADALTGHPLDAPPALAVLAPAAYWADNAPGAGAHKPEVAAGHELNAALLQAVDAWLGLPVALLQVPDTWLRTVEEPGQPNISPALFQAR